MSDPGEKNATDAERAYRAGRTWRELSSDKTRQELPQWWEWAVAMAPYHLADCDWVTIGCSTEHCSCGLTRVIAKILGQPKEATEIRVWRFKNAPKEFQALSPHGGDENWVVSIPAGETGYIDWLESSQLDWSEHALEDGSIIRIGAHA